MAEGDHFPVTAHLRFDRRSNSVERCTRVLGGWPLRASSERIILRFRMALSGHSTGFRDQKRARGADADAKSGGLEEMRRIGNILALPRGVSRAPATMRAATLLLGMRGHTPKGVRRLRGALRPTGRQLPIIPFAQVISRLKQDTLMEALWGEKHRPRIDLAAQDEGESTQSSRVNRLQDPPSQTRSSGSWPGGKDVNDTEPWEKILLQRCDDICSKAMKRAVALGRKGNASLIAVSDNDSVTSAALAVAIDLLAMKETCATGIKSSVFASVIARRCILPVEDGDIDVLIQDLVTKGILAPLGPSGSDLGVAEGTDLALLMMDSEVSAFRHVATKVPLLSLSQEKQPKRARVGRP